MGVYLPDSYEKLGWGRPGCFATAADSGGLKPDRALMWPYLGLRESPRNLLRGAPRGLGNADAVYFLHNPGCPAGRTPATGVPAPIGQLQEDLGWEECGARREQRLPRTCRDHD